MPLIIPIDAWVAVTPEVFSDPTQRGADLYVRCIEQFPLMQHARYARNARGFTKCNIFAQDVVGYAMKTPCPHWVDKTSRDPLAMEPNGLPTQKLNRDELSGNGICEWLQTVGVKRYGWTACSPVEAGNSANAGRPTLVTWLNPGGIGHIGIIRPSAFPNLRMAQAGARNFLNDTVSNGFGTGRNLVYLSHA